MSDRSVTIWNLLVGFTIVSLVATSFKLFPMNKNYNRVKARSSNLQFGTDKELEDIISYLEERLELRSEFQFVTENTPMMLTNVLALADGSGRRVKRNRNAVRVALVYQRDEYFQAQIDYRGQAFTVSVGDTIPNVGIVDKIDGSQVVIKTDGGLKTYPAPGNESVSFNENMENIHLTSKMQKWLINKDSHILFSENKRKTHTGYR
ncbi:MAG TPA: hypothetical protein EYO18_02465 [Candidatus Marinimicrobia bacterium]|nr:hypothetical protein [Candidatus Neomarinimicrobiota bacterium]